jgi:hypothetical protein
MTHVFENASSGRSKCRGCGQPIAKDEVRFGERLPNAFGEGEMTLWYHPTCAAYRRPESVEEALAEDADLVDADALHSACEVSLGGRRVRRIGRAERASSGRARCRSCRETIDKDAWRVPLIFFEEGMFSSSGFVHVSCLGEYCEGAAFLSALMHFARGLEAQDLAEIEEVAS